MTLHSFYADLHIHIGRDWDNKPVKITGSKTLTLSSILKESSRNKGIHMVGVIDSHVPSVQEELKKLIRDGTAKELTEGGIRFEQVTLILGSEIEIYDANCHGPIHVLCFFPTLIEMEQFTEWLSDKMTNLHLSSQRYYGTARELQFKVKELNGLFIPAHVFTPFKSLYGKGIKRSMTEVFDPDLIDGVELGLSADTKMADQISELHPFTFLTNSDAHSLAKIAREYQEIQMKEATFKELYWALHRVEERKVIRNYGMNPLLGKYHKTVCKDCLNPKKEGENCKKCHSIKTVKGVADRIDELKDTCNLPSYRPAYIHQVPLEYIPKLGPKTYQQLLHTFGTEMAVIHRATQSELQKVVRSDIVQSILKLREGKLLVTPGGGGKYGKIK